MYSRLHHSDALALTLIVNLTLEDGLPEAVLSEYEIVLTEATPHAETQSGHRKLVRSYPAIQVGRHASIRADLIPGGDSTGIVPILW